MKNIIYLVSQPKLRRIDKSVLLPTSKSSKEDLLKSQTYQQFMKNMENEIARLEETDQPYNIGEFLIKVTKTLQSFNHYLLILLIFSVYFLDDIDYYSDCIPTKMLYQLSNDVAKLKAKGVVDAISKNKLTLLINFAMRNVDIAKNLSAGPVSFIVNQQLFKNEKTKFKVKN